MTIDATTMRVMDMAMALRESKSGYSPAFGIRHMFTFLENEFVVYAIWEPDMISILTSYDDEIAEYKKGEDGFRCSLHDLCGLVSATAEDVMTQMARKTAPKMSTLRLSELVNEAFVRAGIRHPELLRTAGYIHPAKTEEDKDEER